MRLGLSSQRTWTRAAQLQALVLLALCAWSANAQAVIHPAQVIDGPSGGVVDVDGAAMAPDGTGGIVYRKVVDGVVHIFVARFVGDAFRAPIEVDGGQPFAGSSPRLAAGDGGRLLVVWGEPWGEVGNVTQYELLGSELDPGAEGFGQAIVIDHNVGDASALLPSLSMAANGKADVAYRVVTNNFGRESASTVPQLRPGDELMDVRVARFNGLTWSALGAVNRYAQATMRVPTVANAPVIATDLAGNAVVVWQEPEIGGTARIWARRVFGGALGNVLQVSPDTWMGAQIDADADAPALALSNLGEARVVFRLQGGPGSPFGVPRLLTNLLGGETNPHGSAFTGASLLPGISGASVGPPSVSIDPTGNGGAFMVSYDLAGAAGAITGEESTLGSPTTLGPSSSEAVLATFNPAGGGTTAWQTTGSGGLPVVAVRESFASGEWQQAQLAGASTGLTKNLVIGGSGLGDALIGFEQGSPGFQQVVGALVQAPPAPFDVTTPLGWVRSTAAAVSWTPAPDALGAVTYSVLVGGQVKARGLRGLSFRISARALGDGAHKVQVIAADPAGQQTFSAQSSLRVDANPPIVERRVLRRSRTVVVRVHDAASGAKAGSTRIAWGDGAHTNGRLKARHTYAHGGRFVIVARVRDRVGNHAKVSLRVVVPG